MQIASALGKVLAGCVNAVRTHILGTGQSAGSWAGLPSGGQVAGGLEVGIGDTILGLCIGDLSVCQVHPHGILPDWALDRQDGNLLSASVLRSEKAEAWLGGVGLEPPAWQQQCTWCP